MIRLLRTPSIQTVLAIGAIAALLPLFGMVALMLIGSAQLQQRAVTGELQARTRTLTTLAQVEVSNLLSDLQVLASSPGAGTRDSGRFRSLVERYFASHADWLEIVLLNATGRTLFAVGQDVGPITTMSARTGPPEDGPGGIRILTLHDGPAPLIGVSIAVAGKVDAADQVLVVVPANAFLPTLSDYDRDQGSQIALLDRHHIVLAASNPALAGRTWPFDTTGMPGTTSHAAVMRRATIAGQPDYALVAHLTAAPWDLALVVPAPMLEAPFRLSPLMTTALALLLAIPVVLIVLASRWLSRQVRGLAAIADAVANEVPLPPLVPAKFREIATVQAELVRAADLVLERSAARERLRVMESNLQRLQRLESVGQLAATVAHDFGSHLFAIRGNLQLIRDVTTANSRVQELLLPAFAVADEAGHLIHQLGTLAFRKSPEIARVNINTVLQEMAELLQHLAGRMIQIELHPAERLWDCQFDALRLQSALVNLVTNARDAMPTGGTIRIETCNHIIDQPAAAEAAAPSPGRYVGLVVADNGMGMSPETMAHVFEPFFTTKPEGIGNGIGLSVLSASVRAAGGNISVASEPGRGTTFVILLPMLITVTLGGMTTAV